MVFAHYNKETNELHVKLHKTDIIRAIRGDTVGCDTSKGYIAFRHADKTLDDGIVTPFVWPDKDELEYDRLMTITTDGVVRMLAHDKADKWNATDDFPHRVVLRAAIERAERLEA